MKLIPKFPKRLVCWDGGTFRPIEYHSRPQTEGLYLGPQGPKQVVESVVCDTGNDGVSSAAWGLGCPKIYDNLVRVSSFFVFQLLVVWLQFPSLRAIFPHGSWA